MPLYQTRCPSCNQVGQVWRRIADRDNLPACACGSEVARVLVAPMVQAEFVSFCSTVTGEIISSRDQYREHLRKTDTMPNEPGLKAQIERRRQELIREDEKKLDAVVDDVVTALNVSGRLDYAAD